MEQFTEDVKKDLAKHIVDFLNELLVLDPEAIHSLIEYRVPCNQQMADHSTVQVMGVDLKGKEPSFKMGLLGLLNGLVGIKDTGYGYIYAKFDDKGKLVKFTN